MIVIWEITSADVERLELPDTKTVALAGEWSLEMYARIARSIAQSASPVRMERAITSTSDLRANTPSFVAKSVCACS